MFRVPLTDATAAIFVATSAHANPCAVFDAIAAPVLSNFRGQSDKAVNGALMLTPAPGGAEYCIGQMKSAASKTSSAQCEFKFITEQNGRFFFDAVANGVHKCRPGQIADSSTPASAPGIAAQKITVNPQTGEAWLFVISRSAGGWVVNVTASTDQVSP